MSKSSNLRRVLSSGEFGVTGEVGPPMGAEPEAVKAKAEILRGCCDAYNVTDNQTAVVRMSSIAASAILLGEGLEPVMQMVCRDRNRIAIQSDILGAAALGIGNCLCLSGDHQSFGAAGKLHGHPGAKNVYDIDSIQLLSVLRELRDEARQQGGDSVSTAPEMYIGAAWTPLGDPVEFRVIRLAKKVAAGAEFIQTQSIFDVPGFAEQMKVVRDEGLHKKVAIMAGIIVPKSAGMLRYMNKSVAGVSVPDELIDRMAQAADRKEEGLKVTVELIEQVRAIEGVRGVHIQAIEAEELIPEITKRANLLPRPSSGDVK